MSNIIEIEITPDKELFYNNDFGVYACTTEQSDKVDLNKYGNFVMNGNMQRLVIGKKYQARIQQVQHKKYGLTYQVDSIKQELPATLEAQHAFLRSVLSESHAEALIRAMPSENIIESIKNNAIDLGRIKGIGEKTYAKIKQKIVENFEIQEALVELSQFGVTYKIIKKLISHFGNSPALVVQKVKDNPYVLTEVSGLGYLKVDEYALKMGIERESPFRINAAIEYLLQQEQNNGHCWITIDNAVSGTAEITELPAEFISEHIESEECNGFYKEDGRIGSAKYYKYEKRINDKLDSLLSVSVKFKVDDIESKINNIEKQQGFEFTSEQREAIYKSVSNNILIISGKAGVGKSTILKGIVSVLGAYTYETCAFSGKASQRIVESTGLKSKTVHRLLDFKPPHGFTFNQTNLLTADIIVLDEASMVNTDLFYHLITAIPVGSKLIILGDTEQLPPIGAGNVFKDMVTSGQIPIVELTQVHRQALKSGILLAANHVRDGKQITSSNNYAPSVVGELRDLHIIPYETDENIPGYIIDVCEKSKDKLDVMDFQVIVPMRNRGSICTKNLNVELQRIFNGEEKPCLKRNGYDFKQGDKVIKSGNDYDNGVFNGTLGMITQIDEKEKIATINFNGVDNEVNYTQEELTQIDMAYALTVHKTQGSQFKHVIFALDYSSYVLLNRQLIYTAITRASEKCVLVCENRALRHAISKNDSARRNTYLKEMLQEQKG